MINRITIKNFRSIKTFDESGINNALAFIGENSGGKSTVLDSILVFFRYKDLSELDFHYNEDTIEIGLALDIDDNSIQKLINLCEKNEDDFYKVFKEEYNKKPNRGINTKTYREELKYYFKSEVLKSKNTRYIYLLMKCKDEVEFEVINNNREYFISDSKFNPINKIDPKGSIFNAFRPMIAYIGDERNFESEKFGKKDTTTNNILNVLLKSMKSTSDIVDKTSLKAKTVEELSISELNELLLNKIKEQSVEMLETTNKLFQENYNNNNIEVNWDFDNQLYESIKILSTFNIYGKKEIDFLSIGSGTRNIYLLSLLQSYVQITENSNENENILFIIEEPEIYLYPKLQDDMANILYDISKKHQILITTHSGSIVQKFNINDIYYVKRTNLKNKKNYSKIEKLKDLEILIETLGFNSYPIIKKKYVIFVEGKDDKKEYRKLIEKFYQDEYEDILFISINGVGNIEASLNLQILSCSDLKNRCLIIRDSDCLDNEEAHEKTVKELMKTVGAYYDENKIRDMIYCTERSNLECLTMYPKYCNKDWDEETFYSEYKAFVIENKEIIINKLQNRETIIDNVYDNKYKESSLDYFRKYVVDKEIYKLFKKRTWGFKGIGDIEDETECRELVPLLFKKLDMLFQK
ncbi:AAA family ATPase [Clostridium cochlearium]|uniref:AAA family ATPase n=1 Tax=Clostridium cochlearium TaxID=1494 RepID=A0A7Y3XXS7_CLOCO|nr:AAA family ATPase [Clostridium cochlearium]NOH15290.1 AAA family ATPase [Clostridium cochlearium]